MTAQIGWSLIPIANLSEDVLFQKQKQKAVKALVAHIREENLLPPLIQLSLILGHGETTISKNNGWNRAVLLSFYFFQGKTKGHTKNRESTLFQPEKN